MRCQSKQHANSKMGDKYTGWEYFLKYINPNFKLETKQTKLKKITTQNQSTTISWHAREGGEPLHRELSLTKEFAWM